MRHRAVGLEDPPPDRHERWSVRRRAAARDRRPARAELFRDFSRPTPRPTPPRATVGRCPAPASCSTTCTEQGVPWAIATSGQAATAGPRWRCSACPRRPVVTRDLVARAKPDPDLFLAAAGRWASTEDCFVVGDSVWDLLAARRAGALGVGLLSGGYGREELERPARTGLRRPGRLLPGSTRSASGRSLNGRSAGAAGLAHRRPAAGCQPADQEPSLGRVDGQPPAPLHRHPLRGVGAPVRPGAGASPAAPDPPCRRPRRGGSVTSVLG